MLTLTSVGQKHARLKKGTIIMIKTGDFLYEDNSVQVSLMQGIN